MVNEMLRLAFLTGSIGLLLGSASPPPAMSVVPKLRAELPIADGPQILTYSSAIPAAPEPKPVARAKPARSDPRPWADAALSADAAPPGRAPSGAGVRIVVSLPLQKAYVFDGGELLWTAPVSTGKRGHETPVGTFPILQKKVHHRSSKYDDAPMPYMQRLTWYGIALHAGHVPGYPASHGCIRLPRSYAKKLYNLTDHGTRVTITRSRPASAEAALKLI
jgi:lipoprotein-anchoring transpeptidase ErfK/SrfK